MLSFGAFCNHVCTQVLAFILLQKGQEYSQTESEAFCKYVYCHMTSGLLCLFYSLKEDYFFFQCRALASMQSIFHMPPAPHFSSLKVLSIYFPSSDWVLAVLYSVTSLTLNSLICSMRNYEFQKSLRNWPQETLYHQELVSSSLHSSQSLSFPVENRTNRLSLGFTILEASSNHLWICHKWFDCCTKPGLPTSISGTKEVSWVHCQCFLG